MAHASSLSLIADMRRRSSAEAEAQIIKAHATSTAWIIALHSAACRRWLASEPPGFEEASQTLQLMRELAAELGVVASTAHQPAVRPCPMDNDDPDACLQDLHQRLFALEKALVDVLGAAA